MGEQRVHDTPLGPMKTQQALDVLGHCVADSRRTLVRAVDLTHGEVFHNWADGVS